MTPPGSPTRAPRERHVVDGHDLDLVIHAKERRQHDPQSASGPAACRGAGRGRRRGLDGPTLSNQIQKWGNRICPNHRGGTCDRWLRPVGAGVEGRRAPQGRGRRAQRASSTDSRPLFEVLCFYARLDSRKKAWIEWLSALPYGPHDAQDLSRQDDQSLRRLESLGLDGTVQRPEGLAVRCRECA